MVRYLQKALIANSQNFNDSLNINKIPKLNDYFNSDYFLETLDLRAIAWTQKYKQTQQTTFLKNALDNYQQCDTLISMRKKYIYTKDMVGNTKGII